MNKRTSLRTKLAAVIVTTLLAVTVNGCVDTIDMSNRYTFMGKTVAQFLEDHEDMFSDFIYILERGEKFNLMKAYGTYTCFAPTNEAIERYLFEQDSIYRASLLPGSKKVIWTGITSPKLEELSDSMCEVIAKTHILGESYLTTEMEGDVVPTKNLNDRYLTMSFGNDAETLQSIIFIK